MLAYERFMLAKDHLRSVYGQAAPSDGRIAIYTRAPHTVAFFSVQQIQRAARVAGALSEKTDVYHLVNLISPEAVNGIQTRHGRGTEAELRTVTAIVCEIDTNTGSHRETDYPSQEVALAALSEMPLPPSLVNLSGPNDGGLHVYWILKRPVRVVKPEKRQWVKNVSKGWQARLSQELSPWRLDSTYDLVRVLRVAGCRNHKYRNEFPRPLFRTDRRYRLSDFARYVEPIEVRQKSDWGEEQVGCDSVRADRCRKYLAHVPRAISGQQGHNKTFRAACECFRFGLSHREARNVMEWFNATKTPPTDKWSEAELEHKLETAYETVRDAHEFGVRVERELTTERTGRQ